MKRLFLLITLLVVTVYPQVNFSPLVNLSNTMSATSDYESIFADGSNFHVAWGDNGAIMVKRSTDCGVTWSGNVTVFDGSGVAGYPVLSGAGRDLVILYHYNGPNGYVIHSQRSTDEGNTWSQPQVISTGAGSTGITPKITFDGTTLYAAWEERPAKYQIYFSKSTDMGQTWSTAVNISNTTVDSRWVQVKWENGRLHCIWLDSPSYPAHDIAYIYSDNGGTTWSQYRQLTTDVLPQTRACLQARGDMVYIASQDMYQINFSEIALMKSTDKGLTWSSPVNLTNNSGNSQFADLAIADEPNGQHRIYMAWFDNTHSAPNYDNSDIYFAMSTNSGDTWTQPVNLSNNPDNSYQGRIALKRYPGSDSLFVVWYDYSTGNAEILGRRGVYGYTVPVELISFTGEISGDTRILKWTTSTETNNSHFELFRIRNNSSEFTGKIDGAGTSTESRNYEFIDRSVAAGKVLYHLWQIDLDGTRNFLGEVDLDEMLPASVVLEQNYPNPFNPETVIRYALPVPGYVKGTVYDLLGNEIATLINGEKQAGHHEVKFNGSGLGSGIYIFRLETGDQRQAIKLLLNK